jgi:hypothetical protein
MFDITTADLNRKSSRHPARKVLAKLAHQLTPATYEEIALTLGLAGRDSIHKTILAADDLDIQSAVNEIRKALANPSSS